MTGNGRLRLETKLLSAAKRMWADWHPDRSMDDPAFRDHKHGHLFLFDKEISGSF